MNAVLCSDPRANPQLPESQALTKLVEAYHWARVHQKEFVSPLFGENELVENLYSAWVGEFLTAIAENVPNQGLLILKHPAMSPILKSFQLLIPKMQAVIMVRDPRDIVASELEVAKRAGHSNSAGVEIYADRLMNWFDGLETSGFCVVKYEDMVNNFTTVKQRLERRFDLELMFNPNQQWPTIERLDSLRHYPSWSPKYGQPVDQLSIARWKSDLSENDINIVENVCDRYMIRFGYEKQK